MSLQLPGKRNERFGILRNIEPGRSQRERPSRAINEHKPERLFELRRCLRYGGLTDAQYASCRRHASRGRNSQEHVQLVKVDRTVALLAHIALTLVALLLCAKRTRPAPPAFRNAAIRIPYSATNARHALRANLELRP